MMSVAERAAEMRKFAAELTDEPVEIVIDGKETGYFVTKYGIILNRWLKRLDGHILNGYRRVIIGQKTFAVQWRSSRMTILSTKHRSTTSMETS